MRNLINIQHTRRQTYSELPLAATAWDTTNNAAICAFGPTLEKPVIEIKRIHYGASGQEDLIAAWDALSPLPDLEVDRILNVHYFLHDDSICLVFAGGDIVVVRPDPEPEQEKIEIVGSVDTGIKAAVWSPDEELLAIATSSNTFLFMTNEYEGVVNASFSPEDAKLSKQVSVGWGKKETQFKGKRAHALRDPTMPEHVDDGILSQHDDGRTTISWRGDGAFVSVNTLETIPSQRRMIRVFSRDGDLDSVSEAVDGLESALSWKPSGSLIAGLQRKADHVKVVFFERNGLRHGEFDLRLSSEDLQTWGRRIDLRWNHDSSVLAIMFNDRVQLWTMGNYHYYLKQEVMLTDAKHSDVCNIEWHPEDSLQFALHGIHSQNGGDNAPETGSSDLPVSYSISVLRYVFDVSSGSTLAPNDIGLVNVIDGKCLRLTPLRIANVPPPMALHELDLEHNVIDVAVGPDNMSIAALHQSSITLIKNGSGNTLKSFEPAVTEEIALPTDSHTVAQQICVGGQNSLYAILFDTKVEQLLFHNLSEPSENQPLSETGPSRIAFSPNGDSIHVLCGKQVLSTAAKQISTGPFSRDVSFPDPVTIFKVVHSRNMRFSIGLTSVGALYANSQLIARGCTSFEVTENHLIFTTSNHLLKFVHLTVEESFDVPGDQPELDERCRSVERGAKIVTVMPSTFSVVLQMPRGNLETIYPRALVLAAVRRSVEAKDYKAAFMTCRSQRVDMNIIHDHMPDQLLQSVPLFLDQLKKPGHIDLFLSQISPEDVSKTMYKDTLPQRTHSSFDAPDGDTAERAKESAVSNPEKVNKLCAAFLTALKSRKNPNTQNIITSHLCMIPADIEAGLNEISGIELEKEDAIERAVEHICFLADVNRVYEAALGLYDLRLTLLVAQQSQKDPREYLPYLQKLHSQPQLRRQFNINNDLGRKIKALKDLHAIGDLDEVITYTQSHELYTQALELYRYSNTEYGSLLRLYADHLASRNRFKDAAIAYESLNDYSLASENYRALNLWRESLSCAALSPDSDHSMLQSLAQALADSLEEAKDYGDAASIYSTYLQDVPSAARLFCKAYRYADAISHVARHGQAHLIRDVVDPGIAEGAGTLTELLTECRNQLAAQVPRLRELRTVRDTDPLAFFEGAAPGGDDVPDNISLAPSAASTTGNTFMTRYTNRTGTVGSAATRKTSKNKRREERKRARGKKGSVYEEEYLVNSIGRLVERVNDVGKDVSQTVDACLRRGMRERAAALEEIMKLVVKACTECIDEVYETSKPISGESEQQRQEEVYKPMGADSVLMDSLQERSRRVAPIVKPFESNSLLS